MKKLIPDKIIYFDNIDTEYKAYILGLIYADGCINDKVKGKREWRLQISIQEEDGNILQKLLDDTNKKKLVVRNPPTSVKNNWKKQLTCCINNTYLCEQLSNLGCTPRKSKEGMKFPILNEEFISHFIRGFFDGDGCITVNKRSYKGKKITSENFRLKLAFTSTDKNFLETLISYLPITNVYKKSKLRTLLVHTYWIERTNDIKNVYNYLYKNANYFFQRKYNKFNMPIKSQVIATAMKGLETT